LPKTISGLPAGWYLGVCAQTITAKNIRPEENYIGQFMINANPNPTDHSFTIKVNGPERTGTIILKVINISGQIIETRKINSAQMFTIGENYRPGIYLIQVIQGKESRTLKLIKQ